MPQPDPRIRVMRILTRVNVGGPAVQAAALLRDLDPERFDQRLYAGCVGDDELDYPGLSGPDAPVYRVPTLGRRVRPTDDVRALADLVSEMRRFRPHLVHTHTAKAGVLGRSAARLAGVPARVHTFHGHLLHGYFPPATTRLVTAVERTLARGTDRLVAVGGQVRDDLLRAGIGRPEQYTVIAPGTELGELPTRDQARRELDLPATGLVVGYVGRLTGIKRPDRLVEVARQVRRAAGDATFVVCGAGDRSEQTRAEAADLGAGIRFVGWRADVATIYAASDLVILTSDNEGMPVSLIEAALAGVPAVAPRVGSVAEVVEDGRTGLLCRPDAGDLADATLRLLGDEQLRRTMGARARELAAGRFGRSRLVADIECLYTSIAAERGWAGVVSRVGASL